MSCYEGKVYLDIGAVLPAPKNTPANNAKTPTKSPTFLSLSVPQSPRVDYDSNEKSMLLTGRILMYYFLNDGDNKLYSINPVSSFSQERWLATAVINKEHNKCSIKVSSIYKNNGCGSESLSIDSITLT